MKRLLCTAALLLVAVSVRAADEAKSNTLTPKEIADGWLMLFDGETTFGWRNPAANKWMVKEGTLVAPNGEQAPLIHDTLVNDYQLHLEYQLAADRTATLMVAYDRERKTCPEKNVVRLEPTNGAWHQVQAWVRASNLEVATALTASVKLESKEPVLPKAAPATPGYVALAGNGLVVRNVKIRPRQLQSLFNGKDLTGWKEHPGKKSKFDVKDGAITVKDGPGDLQSEGQWADFILQLECVSNGKNLNSGVFFRCLPGQYQQGYEAQVHNGFLPEATKEYAIEEYDPKTNQLAGTKKEKYAAMDYGSGGIYRRVPARKQMSRDGEWFTMTVAAQGRHIATWVNGYPVVDWTDHRPLKDNARNGCKLEKGHISFQGHDPTTDLSFRNIRIAELPAAEKK